MRKIYSFPLYAYFSLATFLFSLLETFAVENQLQQQTATILFRSGSLTSSIFLMHSQVEYDTAASLCPFCFDHYIIRGSIATLIQQCNEYDRVHGKVNDTTIDHKRHDDKVTTPKTPRRAYAFTSSLLVGTVGRYQQWTGVELRCLFQHCLFPFPDEWPIYIFPNASRRQPFWIIHVHFVANFLIGERTARVANQQKPLCSMALTNA